MSSRQASVIIGLLVVIAVALGVGIGYLVVGRDDDEAAPAAGEPTATSAPPTSTEEMVADPVAALEAAGVDVVQPPPVPEAPEAWGEYTLAGSWDGRVRAFDNREPAKATAEDGSTFPASMNGCGEMIYFVTFRATDDGDAVDAQLLDAVGGVNDSEVLGSGWMLGTNCATPAFVFDTSADGATMIDVAFTVHEYRQSSVAQSSAAPQPQAQDPAPAPAAPTEPTFVECIFGTPGPARFSDGSIRNHPPCAQTPEAQRYLEAESVCGGLNGWEVYGREKYESLCGPVPEGR